MASYVIESIDEAAKKTRDLLLPFDLTTWSKLALIVLLTGGIGFSFPGVPGFGGGDYDPGYGSDMKETGMGDQPVQDASSITGAFSSSSLLIAGAVLAAGLGLLALFISSVFEFVYYQSLIDEKINIRGNFSDNLDSGARYFNFRVLYGFMLLLLFGTSIASFILNPLLVIPMLFALIPLAVLFYAANTLIHDFVLLEMLQQDRNFLESVSQVYRLVKDNLRKTTLYLIVRMAVTLLAATAIGMGTLMVLIILAIPITLLGIVFYMISELLLIPLILLGVLLTVLTTLYVTVPMKTFIYYYAITVYGELSE
jgi:hypothetical protein